MVQQGLPELWFAGDAIAIAVEPRLVSGIALLDVVRTVLVGLGAALVWRPKWPVDATSVGSKRWH